MGRYFVNVGNPKRRELYLKESYKKEEDGSEYEVFSLRLPLFGTEIQGRERMNQMIKEIERLALKDRDSFFQEIREMEGSKEDYKISFRKHDYFNLYIGDRYVSFYYYVMGYNGGIRTWEEAMPLTFDRETGEHFTMDKLFTVDRTVYMKRLTSAIYKYKELEEDYLWGGFYQNILVKNFKPECFYLTPYGIVLCYQRYAIAAGACGNPTFEIPYSWFADIFVGE